MSGTTLVTGATGFVGSHVVAQLRDDGVDVRVLVRDPKKLASTPLLAARTDLDVVTGDVTDPTTVATALDGCEAVVHAAAHVSLVARDAAHVDAVNVGGTRLVLGGAAERELRAVHVSSASIFRNDAAVVTTDAPLADGGRGYTGSKVAAEQVVRTLQAEGANIASVYPSGVLGPDTPSLTSTHEGLIGWVRTPPKTTSGTSIVDVRDVALAISHALTRGTGRWMLGGTYLDWDALHDRITAVTGVARRAVPMPPGVLRFAGRVGDVVQRVIPFEYPLTLEAMTFATTARPYDSDATCRDLGIAWRPVDVTLGDSIRWLAAHGHLPAKLAGTLAGADS